MVEPADGKVSLSRGSLEYLFDNFRCGQFITMNPVREDMVDPSDMFRRRMERLDSDGYFEGPVPAARLPAHAAYSLGAHQVSPHSCR